MNRFNLLSLLLSVALILLFSQIEVQAAGRLNRQLMASADNSGYPQYLSKALKERRYRASLTPADIELLNALRKRQIRYHPCYFNPVSCFRRK